MEKRKSFYIFQQKVCLLLVSDSNAMLNASSYLYFQNLKVSTPTLLLGFLHVSWDLYGQTNIQQTILLGEEKSRRFGHLNVCMLVVAPREGKQDNSL